mgnify:CR=1 FL=1
MAAPQPSADGWLTICDGSLRGEVLEKVVGAEMTRRTFTNCCNIMRRHDFVGHWRKWQLSATPY